MRWSVGFAFIVCILLNIFVRPFLSIYGQGEGFMQEGIPVVRVVSFALVLMSIATIWLNAVTGTGQSKINLAIEFIAIINEIIVFYISLIPHPVSNSTLAERHSRRFRAGYMQ